MNPLTQALCAALREVIGTYGVAVICTEQPDLMVGARRSSPLIIGIGEGENFLTSDADAIVAHTGQVVFLNDYDVATITRERFDVLNAPRFRNSNGRLLHSDPGKSSLPGDLEAV